MYLEQPLLISEFRSTNKPFHSIYNITGPAGLFFEEESRSTAKCVVLEAAFQRLPSSVEEAVLGPTKVFLVYP